MPQPKLGLVLGSGSSRGWAHIGVIEAFEEQNIEIHMITGASAGSFIAASYAGGGLENIKKFALDMDWKRVLTYLDIAFPRSGFIDSKKVADLIKLYTNIENIEDLKIPVQMVTTDMHSGEQVVLKKGSVTEALRASMAVPGLLTPIQIEDAWLVDGGVVNPLPIDVCRDMGADIVVAVDLNSERKSKKSQMLTSAEQKSKTAVIEKKRLEVITSWIVRYGPAGKAVSTKIDQWFSREEPSPHIFEILVSSLNIMQRKIEQMNLETHPPDILIRPRLGDMKFFDYDQAEIAIEEGYRRGKEAIPTILEQINSFSHQ